MKTLTILGSTGSVGTNVLRVVEAFPERFRVVGRAAGPQVEGVAAQLARHPPRIVSVADEPARAALGRLVDLSACRVETGEAGMIAAAIQQEASMVVASAVGAVGLVPTYRALEAGKDVALANKETLVMAGELMLREARAHGARLLPIDSEHCAIHQCLEGRPADEVRRLILTASGGPFRSRARGSFHSITPQEALNHPTWSMGPKITVDSATLMNKGLEVIEARWLFDVAGERIDVLIHPQSIIHSMVEFVDGSVLAQLGVTDMRVPIQYALSHPERWQSPVASLDFAHTPALEFETPDRERFPCLGLAYAALARGGTHPAVLNAANEVAVQAFLEARIPFPSISDCVGDVLASFQGGAAASLDDVIEADRWSRQLATEVLSRTPARAAS